MGPQGLRWGMRSLYWMSSRAVCAQPAASRRLLHNAGFARVHAAGHVVDQAGRQPASQESMSHMPREHVPFPMFAR